MIIHGLNKTTLLDYPGHIASTIFTGSCNFRCSFCHNGNLVLSPKDEPVISETEIFNFLEKRKNIIDGVCITGGEPTLQKDLIAFIHKIKTLGLLVKLDTNGYRPDVIKQLLRDQVLDMVAMDIKSSPQEYGNVAAIPNFDFQKIQESVVALNQSGIDHEFRTTVVKELHTEIEMQAIANWLPKTSRYFLQNYRDSEFVISKGHHSVSTKEMNHFLSIVRAEIPNTKIRGES